MNHTTFKPPSAFKTAAHATPSADRLIRIWLYSCLTCVVFMVFVGGVTRLTESGLSIVEWDLISGILPPMSRETWEAELEAYRDTPEYQQINRGMSVEQFKQIYWLEWLHRLLGRITGLVFLVPYLYFLVRRQLNPMLIRRGLIAGLLVAAQGGVGWVMVQSGLVDDPRVSPVKLAMHLSLAFAVFGYTLWTLWLLRPPAAAESGLHPPAPQRAFWPALGLTGLLFVQIVLGAIVAGMDAGLTYNTWPLMDGRFIPDGLMLLEPWYRNLLANVTMVQFQHRMGAYVLTACVLLFVGWRWAMAPIGERRRLIMLTSAIFAQMILGIATVLYIVPIGLASAHQLLALVLWVLMLRECFLRQRLIFSK